MQIDFSKREVDDLVAAMQSRICWLETRTTTHRATDAEQHNSSLSVHKVIDRQRLITINALTTPQMEIIVNLEKLIKKLQKPA